MATGYSPKIVTDGLVLALDAANIKSFRGEPTTNLVASSFDTTFESLADGNTAGFTNQLGSGNYLGVSSNIGYNSNKSLRVNRGSIGATFGRIFRTYSVTSGQYFSVSAWVYSTVSGPFLAIEFFGGDYTWGVSQNRNTHTGSGWELLWVSTTGVATSNTTGYYFFYPAVDNVDTYLDNFQVEFKPYNTPYVNGTRGTTVATGGGWKNLAADTDHGELVNGPRYNSDGLGNIVFDGVNDYIPVSQPNITFSPNRFTVCFWMKPNNQYARFITPNSNGIDQWIEYNNGGQRVDVRITEIADVNNRSRAGTTNSVPIGSWSFVCVSIDNLTINIYVNGVLTNTYTETIQIGNWSGTWNIGQRGNSSSWYSGAFGAFNIYNRALSASEVLQNYNATKRRFGL